MFSHHFGGFGFGVVDRVFLAYLEADDYKGHIAHLLRPGVRIPDLF
ncbi:hypothetical protein ES708_22182 [subsurface metagenome]|jgi:hypothetical protein